MKTKKFLSMAALALVGAMMTGCSSDDDILQPENKTNVVTLTATVGFDDGVAATRAVTGTGVKTFADGDQMAVIYQNTSKEYVKAVGTLTSGAGTKSGTFTFTLTNPSKGGNVTYIYPAAMAGSTDVDYTKLNSQDGTLASLQTKHDLAMKIGSWKSGALPSLTLNNKLAILAITLKDEEGTSEITGSTTKLTVSDGTNTYNVNRSVAAGPIYVAIRPTSDATIDITATSDSKGYYKILTTPKSYTASNGYSVSWKMTQGAILSKLTAAYTAQNGDKLTGTLGSNVKISIADGATVTLNNVTINGTDNSDYEWAGITCLGNATIILSGTNTVKGFDENYPGIQAAAGNTLTIQGTGSLTASSNGYGAGIGGGFRISCGNITITGGTIDATGGSQAAGIGGGQSSSCGNIYITGGTIDATGGSNAAGIGSGYAATNKSASCGDITITSGVTRVTATKGSGATNSIGKGKTGSNATNTCGTVTIGGVVGAITDSPYTYQP